MASGLTSAQSMSSCGGEAKTMVSRIASTPYSAICSPRSTPLPSDLDIALPRLMTCPWLISRVNGSPNDSSPMSCSTLVKNRAYSRCRMACSTPPTYRSTGAHRSVSATRNGPSAYRGEQYRNWYHEESTKVSIVSVSRSAAPPHFGQSTFTQSAAAASGDTPCGCRSAPRRSGSTTGSWSSGTGTSPHDGQWMIGIGVPQNRCRDTSQSRSR